MGFLKMKYSVSATMLQLWCYHTQDGMQNSTSKSVCSMNFEQKLGLNQVVCKYKETKESIKLLNSSICM